MVVLIIDTSREQAFVALVVDGEVVGERTWRIGGDMGRQVLDAVDELLKRAELKLEKIDRVGVRTGSGHRYSALRAGVTVANMLAYAAGADVVGFERTGRGDLRDLIREVSVAKPVEVALPRYVDKTS